MSLFIIFLVFSPKLFSTVLTMAPPKPLTEEEKNMPLVKAAQECRFRVIEHVLSKDVNLEDVDTALVEAKKTLSQKKKQLEAAVKPPKQVKIKGVIVLEGVTPLAVQESIQRAVYRCEGVIKYLEHFKKMHELVKAVDVENLKVFLQKHISNKIIESAIKKASDMKAVLQKDNLSLFKKIKRAFDLWMPSPGSGSRYKTAKRERAALKENQEKLKKIESIVALLQKKKEKTQLPVSYYQLQPMPMQMQRPISAK